jgi:hypothetical protein
VCEAHPYLTDRERFRNLVARSGLRRAPFADAYAARSTADGSLTENGAEIIGCERLRAPIDIAAQKRG